MKDKYNKPKPIDYDFFRSLLPLHETRIVDKLIDTELDLMDFLDFAQIQLDRFKREQKQFESRSIRHSLFDNTEAIAGAERIIKAILLLKESGQKIQLISLALFLTKRTGFLAPTKNNAAKWNEVLREFGFDKKTNPSGFTGGSLGQQYNLLNRPRVDYNLKEIHFKEAEQLFNKFVDPPGLKNLLIAKNRLAK